MVTSSITILYRLNVHFVEIRTKLLCLSELQSSLERFIKEKTIEYYDSTASNAIESVQNETLDVEDVIKKWEKLFKDVTSSLLL